MFSISSIVAHYQKNLRLFSNWDEAGRMDPALSVYFDLVRFGAALIVVMNHYGVLLSLARGSTFPGSDAVIVFFVLSGYVIAYVSDRPGMTARRYALDRLSRLWSVAVPAAGLALVLGLGVMCLGLQSGHYGIDSPKALIVGSIINVWFLGESWGQTFAPYNFPFWSVNYEAWYYIIFGLWLFLHGRNKIIAVIGACLLAGPSILIFMPIWLLGAALYQHRMKLKVPNTLAIIMFLFSIAGYSVIYHFHLNVISRVWLNNITDGESYHLGPSTSIFSAYPIALLVAVNFVAVANMRLSKIILPDLKSFAQKVSAYTLTIYLFHMPLFYVLRSFGIGHGGVGGKILLFLLSGATIVVIAPITEHKRLAWRNGLTNALFYGMKLFALVRHKTAKPIKSGIQ